MKNLERDRRFEETAPWIKWREPIKLVRMDSSTEFLSCRYCISAYGIKGEEIGKVSFTLKTMEEFEKHMREEHGDDNDKASAEESNNAKAD